MSDYNLTRSVAGQVVTRFASMLEDLEDDYEEEIVVASLVKYHRSVSKEPDEDLLWAIERVLQDFMTTEQFYKWNRGKALDALAKADVEDDLI